MPSFESQRGLRLLTAAAVCLITVSAPGLPALGAGGEPATILNPQKPPEPLAIVSPQGRTILHVEVVDDAVGRQRGLMGRRELAPDAGMLFDYQTPVQATMWMKNTPLSLDMIFIGEDGRVVRVAENTQPFSETLIPSFVEVRAVLEVGAGTARRLGIGPGTRIEHPIFGTGVPAYSPN